MTLIKNHYISFDDSAPMPDAVADWIDSLSVSQKIDLIAAISSQSRSIYKKKAQNC